MKTFALFLFMSLGEGQPMQGFWLGVNTTEAKCVAVAEDIIELAPIGAELQCFPLGEGRWI